MITERRAIAEAGYDQTGAQQRGYLGNQFTGFPVLDADRCRCICRKIGWQQSSKLHPRVLFREFWLHSMAARAPLHDVQKCQFGVKPFRQRAGELSCTQTGSFKIRGQED